jgi:hypothetical protein
LEEPKSRRWNAEAKEVLSNHSLFFSLSGLIVAYFWQFGLSERDCIYCVWEPTSVPLKGEEEMGGGGNLYSAGQNPLRKKKKKPSGTRSRSQSIGESKTERTSKKSVKMFSVLERKKIKVFGHRDVQIDLFHPSFPGSIT